MHPQALTSITGMTQEIPFKSVTVLWMAASRPDRSVVALFLDHDADPGIGESALELAIKMGSIEIVELLSGANR